MDRPLTSLLVKPFAWDVYLPRDSGPLIQLFAHTASGESIYVRLPCWSTYLLLFAEEIDEETQRIIQRTFSPWSLQVDEEDPRIAIVRTATGPDKDVSPTWLASRHNPVGELAALWQARDITPYGWLTISNYQQLTPPPTSCQVNITCGETAIQAAPAPPVSRLPRSKVLYWDIEVLSEQVGTFPDARRPGDRIILISVILAHTTYVFGPPLPPSTAVAAGINYFSTADEAELITRFLQLLASEQADNLVYYNGDTFDLPYLLQRVELHRLRIPALSKLLTMPIQPIIRDYLTPYGEEKVRGWALPGTNTLDLLNYYRRFYPYLASYKLDSVAHQFLGRGKEALTIAEMMRGFHRADQQVITQAISYAATDARVLAELWDQGIDSNLTRTANNLRVSKADLLQRSWGRLVDSLVSSVLSPALLFLSGTSTPLNHLRPAAVGVYRQVYVYDYTQLYLLLLEQSNAALARALNGAPPELIVEVYHSKYVASKQLSTDLVSRLAALTDPSRLISVEPTILRSFIPLTAPGLILVGKAVVLVVTGQASYLALQDDGQIASHGATNLTRPKFSLAKELIDNYVRYLASGLLPPTYNLQTTPLPQLIMRTSLAPPNRSPVKQRLVQLLGREEVDGVDYLVSRDGVILVEQITPATVPDYAYYVKQVNKYLHRLASLPLYQ